MLMLARSSSTVTELPAAICYYCELDFLNKLLHIVHTVAALTKKKTIKLKPVITYLTLLLAFYI